MEKRTERKGTAVALPVTLLALTLLLPVMVARHQQGSHTRGNVARTVRGGQLMDLGRAALAEAWWNLEQASVNSGDPLFMRFREGSKTVQSFDVKVPHVTTQLVEDPALAGIKVENDAVRVSIAPRRATSNRTREGNSDVTVEVKVRHAAGFTRTLRESREMRVALLTLPPPFDEPSLMVLDAASLVGEQTNAWMEEAVSLVTQIATAAKVAGATDIGGEPPAPLVDELEREIHRFPSRYVVRSRARRIDDVSALFLRSKIEPIRRRIEAMGPPTDLAGQAVGDPDGAGAKARTLAQAHMSLLETAREYQKGWEELGGVDADFVSMLSLQLEPEEWRRRAFFRFEGQGAAKRCLEMLDRYAAEDPPRPVNGVVFVDNQDDALKLKSRVIRGRLVIVATGSVEIEEVKLASRATDLLVVQAEGLMVTGGRIEGSLVVRGGIDMRADTVIAGSLILKEVRSLDRLGGRIESDTVRTRSVLDGLDRPEMFWIAFAPVATARQMETE